MMIPGMTLNSLPGQAMYAAQQPLQPLPPWLPPNVHNYINNGPSYGEGQPQGEQWGPVFSGRSRQEPPQPQAPQISDLQRLFYNSILRNAPTANSISGPLLRSIIQTGHLAGGEGI
jgi:hypothetical protein